TADQLHRTKDTVSIATFKKIVANRVRLEDELTMDPACFYRLPALVPQITGVDIQLRRGKFLNEITKYHYDVWLYVNRDQKYSEPVQIEKWHSIELVERLLEQAHGRTVAIQEIPNQRTASDLTIATKLEELSDSDTIGTLKKYVEQIAGHDGVDPNDLWDVAGRYGYYGHVRWSTDGTDGLFEAIFIAEAEPHLLPPPIYYDNTISIQEFIRIPGENAPEIGNEQLMKWRSNLRKSLPDYMLPNDW